MNYSVKAWYEPNPVKRGQSAKICALFTNADQSIAGAKASVVKYGITRTMEASGNAGEYCVSVTLPKIVPAGDYEVSVYAFSTSGERGPQYKFVAHVI